MIFIKNTEEFSAKSAIPIDNQATLAIVQSNGNITGYIKGLPSKESLKKLEILAGN